MDKCLGCEIVWGFMRIAHKPKYDPFIRELARFKSDSTLINYGENVMNTPPV